METVPHFQYARVVIAKYKSIALNAVQLFTHIILLSKIK